MAKTGNTKMKAMDGNEAAARVAYALSEVIAIYPITPSSPMGELSDAWAAAKKPNLWGTIPNVVEMQSEGGAAGAVHGALTAGALTATFTASQGLLLMIPNMYKIAGELTPAVFHVASRSVACQALSIFGDHSDVMATRATGWAMLSAGSVQEVMDFALVAHAASLKTRIPFLHFFEGFRISHMIQKIHPLTDDDLRALIDPAAIDAARNRRLGPERPHLRGTAQNPDVFFQARETVNPFYDKVPKAVEEAMDALVERTGRRYGLFDYYGAPDAERVLVLMGGAAGATEECVDALRSREEGVGLLKVRLYRPFSAKHLIDALPTTVERIAVLDRTKEPGSLGEPLYLDVSAALAEYTSRGGDRFGGRNILVTGGRYGLGSKQFTPAMAVGIFKDLAGKNPKPRFTSGIKDDVTGLSIDFDPAFSTEDPKTTRCVFFGLGSDGTVGANKNSIKIIAARTDLHAQGYFKYDSKKSGSMTVSHLRFGPNPIRSTYLITEANFIACHQEALLKTVDVMGRAAEGGTFLLNTTAPHDEVWSRLPREVQEIIIAKKLRFFVIDGERIAREAGLGGRINTVMQTAFFHLTDIIEDDIAAIKDSISMTFGRKGRKIVEMNFTAVDNTIENLKEVKVPRKPEDKPDLPRIVPDHAGEFVKKVTAPIMAGRGDELPVSVFPPDGCYPLGTAKWEKRNIGREIPVWDERWCIQCNKCVFVCPHSTIRAKAYPESELKGAPKTFKHVAWKGRDLPEGTRYTIQVAPEDCVACGLCVEVCPAKNKEVVGRKAVNMEPQSPLRERERDNWEFFDNLPDPDLTNVDIFTVKGSQLKPPLFEFSGACAGCGETPYVKLLTQLFGDRLAVANATGCSSIYGGNLPATPWTAAKSGCGPAWSNSLFEDNAEFGMGFRLAYDKHGEIAEALLKGLAGKLDGRLVAGLLKSDQRLEAGVVAQRDRVAELKIALRKIDDPKAKTLLPLADAFVKKTVWIVGGDGWAYDIGFAGLDHVLASGLNVNVLVLDTELYSNTGGQASKATPRAAVAKFAASGKDVPRKDLAIWAMSYGTVYVARVAMGASDSHTVKAFKEAEAYPGASIIIAYSHCIAHGFNLRHGLSQQKLAVESGYWPLMRFDPSHLDRGDNPLHLDSHGPKIPLEEYAYNEARYRMLSVTDPKAAAELLQLAQDDVHRRWKQLEGMASLRPEMAATKGGRHG